MPGKATAVHTGNDLVQKVVALAHQLGLESRTQVAVGRRLWGALRKIDVVLTHPETRRTLGVECKFQGTKGSAEEKIPSTIQDLSAWPIPGIVVFAGSGFSPNMRVFLLSTGKAVELDDLRPWISLYFGLADEA